MKRFESPRRNRRHPRWLHAFLTAVLATPLIVAAQTTQPIQLELETAPTVTGPWTKIPAQDAFIGGDGSLGLTAAAPNAFFRLKPEALATDGTTPFVAFTDLPEPVRSRAQKQMQELMQLGDSGEATGEFAPWRGAVFGPLVIPIYDPVYEGGEKPAFYEFKIIAPPTLSGEPVNFLAGGEREQPSVERGFLLLAMNEEDPPAPGFGVSGPTPGERLLRSARSPRNVKLLRYGPMFLVLEDEGGRLLANFGAQPFKLTPDLLGQMGRRFGGDYDSDRAISEPGDGFGGPSLRPENFPSYEAFKEDYVSNPVLRQLRENRAKRVRPEWELVKGLTPPAPPVIAVPVRAQVHVFPGEPITEYAFDDDDEAAPLADVSLDRINGGLRITGNRVGDADLIVERAAGVQRHLVHVVAPSLAGEPRPRPNAFTPGWQTAQVWKAGNYAEQPRYYQIKDDLWCDAVGCGPVAWAILLAWWDRHGVPSALAEGTAYQSLNFSLRTADATLYIDPYVSSSYARIFQELAEIHEACDVICDPFSDAGATGPSDMIEALYPVTSIARGWIGSTQLPEPFRYMGMSYGWSWDLNDPDWNEPSNRIRKSVKAGRPAIVGLGWLWHYGVAYAYLYQEFKYTEGGPAVFKRRWFKVNEGWGKENGAWYSGGDTFLGTNLKLWQRSLPPP